MDNPRKAPFRELDWTDFRIYVGGGESESAEWGMEEKLVRLTLFGTWERRVIPSMEISLSKDKENLELVMASL